MDFKCEGKLLEDGMHGNDMILCNFNDHLDWVFNHNFCFLCNILAEREKEFMVIVLVRINGDMGSGSISRKAAIG